MEKVIKKKNKSEKASKKIITERDKKILEIINKYGSVKKETIFRLLCDKEKHKYVFYRRLKILSERDYININHYSCILSKAGNDFLSSNGIKLNYKSSFNNDKRIKYYKYAEILTRFNTSYIMSRKEFIDYSLLEGNSLNNVKTFIGVIWDDEYNKTLVYKFDDPLTPKLRSYIIEDVNKTNINNILLVDDNMEHLKKDNEFIRKNINENTMILPNKNESFIVHDLYRKGYLNNEYIVEYLNSVSDNLDIKIEGKNLKIDGYEIINSLIFNCTEFIKKYKKLGFLNVKKIGLLYFDFMEELFTDDSFIPSDDNYVEAEYFDYNIDLNKFSSFLEKKHGYIKPDFKNESSMKNFEFIEETLF